MAQSSKTVARRPSVQRYDTKDLYGRPWEMGDAPHGHPPPVQIVVRELDMAPPGSLYPFVFHKPDRAQAIGNPPTIASVIRSVRGGNYVYQKPVNQYFRPLDLHLSRPTCFIFRLSDRWNWRFCHKSKGALMGDGVPTARRTNYTNLRHILDDDIGIPTPHPHEEYCKIICFNAIPPAGTPPTGIVDPFKLVVEFVYPDGDPDAQGNTVPNTIPILIDPDVRFPGGSGGQ